MNVQSMMLAGDSALAREVAKGLKQAGIEVLSQAEWRHRSQNERADCSVGVLVIEKEIEETSGEYEQFATLFGSQPTIVLVPEVSTTSVARFLDAGANDVVVWSDNFAELLARIRSLQRRRSHHDSQQEISQETKLGRARLTPEGLMIDDRTIPLTPQEQAILRMLGRVPRQVVPQTSLAYSLHPDSRRPVSDRVRSAVSRLRRKLKLLAPAAEIQAVYRYGYRLLPP